MKTKNTELLNLAIEILKNIELNELPLKNIVSKTLRFARIRGDVEGQKWLSFEFAGYGSTGDVPGVPPDQWEIGRRVGRHYKEYDTKTQKHVTYMHTESVGRIETEIETSKEVLKVSADPNISISSANPYQTVTANHSNFLERANLKSAIIKWTSVLEYIKASIYKYVLEGYYELKFGRITEAIFDKTRSKVDEKLSTVCPEGVKELVAVYENLSSHNDKDWSNAANSCRRLLKDLADVLFPASRKKSEVKLTEDAYINRLIAFIESKKASKKFEMIVGSHLKFIGERLDAITNISGKGVHKSLTKEEAERLVIYTYLVVGDILTLI